MTDHQVETLPTGIGGPEIMPGAHGGEKVSTIGMVKDAVGFIQDEQHWLIRLGEHSGFDEIRHVIFRAKVLVPEFVRFAGGSEIARQSASEITEQRIETGEVCHVETLEIEIPGTVVLLQC